MFTPGHGEVGGAARRSALLAGALAERGWDVRVVTRAATRHRFSVMRQPNLVVVEVPGFGQSLIGALLFLLVGVPLGMAWAIRRSVFVAIQLVSPTYAAAVCSKVSRRPFLALSTTSGSLSEAAYLLKGRMAPLRRLLIRDAAYLVAQTDAAAVELSQLTAPERVVVMPNPVAPVAAPSLTGATRVAYTGRLSDEKDLPRLLEAWAIVACTRPDALLTLAGDGGLYRSVEGLLHRLVRDDPVLARTVRFTGWVSDVGAVLSEADVYVFPSLSEGMSNSLLEACAWGRVVVASDIPSNRAVLGWDYPLLFRAGDTESLIAVLMKALDDEQARVSAVAHIADRMRAFSLDTVVSRLEELMNSALAGAPHDRAGSAVWPSRPSGAAR